MYYNTESGQYEEYPEVCPRCKKSTHGWYDSCYHGIICANCWIKEQIQRNEHHISTLRKLNAKLKRELKENV